MIKRRLKMLGITIGIVIGVFVLAYFLFVNLHPAFGADPSASDKVRFAKSPQYRDDVFRNIGGVENKMGFGDMFKSGVKYFQKQEGTVPESVPVQTLDSLEMTQYQGAGRMVWFGHSTFLWQIGGKNILLDPMFGTTPAPHPALGSKRFNTQLPLEIERLPKIDLVVFSHDHYDHLDYDSVLALKDKVERFVVPLGVGLHLYEWGVPKAQVEEMDWGEETQYENVFMACTPAQHFSGRKISNWGSTLWASWVLEVEGTKLFFSGDSGYGPHFKQIGETYGPFDMALMECGQYNELWKEIHMMPEQTVQAAIDVGAKEMMPIHWGAFKLAFHTWDDPVLRASKRSEELQMPMIVPKIGQWFTFGRTADYQENWWE
ncbi:MBL fold metallo-hydrolase [Sediminicola luteus]|nr:MBL fold metallo-hydrolase [Sediminicola luteus]